MRVPGQVISFQRHDRMKGTLEAVESMDQSFCYTILIDFECSMDKVVGRYVVSDNNINWC